MAMERWVLQNIHRDIQIHKATCSCSQKHKDARHSRSHVDTKGSHAHTLTNTHPGTQGYTVTGIPAAFFQRKPRALGTQMEAHLHTDRHTGTKMANHTHSVHRDNHTQSHMHSGMRSQKQQRQANTLKDTREQRRTTSTLRNTPGHGLNLLRYTHPPRG